MAKLGDFIAFQAAVELLKDQDKLSIMDEVYQLCKTAEIEGKLKEENFVKRIYESFSYEEVSKKIASLLTNDNINAEVRLFFKRFQTYIKPVPITLEIGILQVIILPRRE